VAQRKVEYEDKTTTEQFIYVISVRPIISIFDALIFAKFSGLVEIWLLLSAKLNLKNFQSPKWANRGDKMERESRRCNTQHTQYRIYYSNSRKGTFTKPYIVYNKEGYAMLL